MTRPIAFSGLQPTGNIHLGNYLGAVRNWVRLQEDYDCVYCVVDLHAITVPQDPEQFAADRRDAARVLVACGIDPSSSLFYYQSQVPQHTELMWILATMTPTGVLNRMTQFKEKADQAGSNLGLYAYPVLMAADIMLFHANAVPVGDDQKQHLEMTRDLAERFNNRFGDTFPIPEPIIPETAARVMSLQDPSAKMSKSDPNEASRILILDSPDAIRKKVSRAVTDSDNEVRFDWEEKPGVSNLIEIMANMSDLTVPQIEEQYGTGGYGAFKSAVAEAIIEELAPVRARYKELDPAEVERLMQKGALDARTRAEGLQQVVRKAVGISR